VITCRCPVSGECVTIGSDNLVTSGCECVTSRGGTR